MTRKRAVMRIFRVSSGILNMVMSFCIGRPLVGEKFQTGSLPDLRGNENADWRTSGENRGLTPPGSPRRRMVTRKSVLLGFRGPRLHLVPLRLLGRRDDLGGTALGLDLFQGGLGEVMGPDHQPL